MVNRIEKTQAIDSVAYAKAQQSSIYQLLECALLEAWMPADHYQLTTAQALAENEWLTGWSVVHTDSLVDSVWRVLAANCQPSDHLSGQYWQCLPRAAVDPFFDLS